MSTDTQGSAGSLCLLTIISDPGKADIMARYAMENGALTAFHFYAHGTVPGHLLAFLGLSGVRREMICLTVQKELGVVLMDELCGHFHIGRELNGIAFLLTLDGEEDKDSKPSDYTMLAAVVSEGEGEYVVESARRCHPVGATILKALGTADHSRKTFDFDIVPQKELVLIVSPSCQVEALYRAVYRELQTEDPGRGILFSFGLDRVAGLLDVGASRKKAISPDCEGGPVIQTESGRVALLALADRGHTDRVMGVVEACGGTGATILHCRMASSESTGWYSRLADPEKELALIITDPRTADRMAGEFSAPSGETQGTPLPIGRLKVSRFLKFSGLTGAR